MIFSGPGVRPGLEGSDQPAAAQVRRQGFGDQNFGIGGKNLIDVEAIFGGDFVALSSQRVVDRRHSFRGEIEQEEAHQ